MHVYSDYKDLLKSLNKHKAQYLIIGAYAVIYYTEPRYTKDLDIWVEPEKQNAQRVYAALKEFGAPLKNITPENFMSKTLVYQIGVAPVRVDIITSISDAEFNVAWKHRKAAIVEGVKTNIIGIDELIESKRAANRPQDLIDVDSLQMRLKLQKKK